MKTPADWASLGCGAASSARWMWSALLRCGDHEGLGRKILTEHTQELRGRFARHALEVLESARSGGRAGRIAGAGWDFPTGSCVSLCGMP